MNMVKRGKQVMSPVLGKYFPDFEIEKGSGCFLFGADGKKYLDFSSGIAVCGTGHAHPKVVKAACDQIHKLIHICIGVAQYDPYVTLCEKLAKIVPIKEAQFFLCQSGSEAVEAAIKLAKYAANKPGIIAIKGCFHGRTMGALSITSSKMKYREGYEPLLPEVYICEQNLEDVERILKTQKIAGVITEPILGEGGYIPLAPEFLKGLRSLTEKYSAFLIFDEIQTGFGRSGRWFVSNHLGISPDIICLAKGIASGFPLGAIGASKSIMEKWSPGSHGGTYGGNPVCCAGAIATIEVIEEENLLQNAEEMGNYLKQKLIGLQKKYPLIKDVRGLGLMLGVDIGDFEIVRKIMDLCLTDGLVLIPTGADGTVFRFIPPLIVTKAQIDQALAVFEKALGYV